ncbi:MAG: LysM peptidoglycan-binding domain-containing protein [Cyanobacteria bacterium SZAS LIN-3]|nr:LysM peptidoglycan-binding domain-containing protein [Cyanobacteria bacterium SZAS LIN-3]
MPPLELSHSQPIDQGALQHLTPAAPDCSFAREVQSQVASLAQPMPGAESMLGAPGIPGVPGVEQAISPLVQMIMRMPGHIGLASSFFEALGNFFLPQTDMLSIFDPSNFGLHIDLSGAMPADHGSIDFSLLPDDAPLLSHLAGAPDFGTAGSLDLASDKLNLSLGGESHFVSDHSSTSLSMGSQLNVSGGASFARPQFEGAGGLVSGPNLSDNFQANSLAANNRLFSDGAGIANANQTMLAAGSSSAAASGAGTTAMTAAAPAPALSQAGTGIADNVSAHASSANNVSYNVFEKLAGNKDILAANNVGDTYHSTIGTIQPDAVGDAVSKSAGAHSAATTGGDLGGLQAKPMSLNGAKMDMHADHAAAAHTQPAHQNIEHKVETKAVEAAKAQPHAVEHKIERAVTAAKPVHVANQINHVNHAQAVRPVGHAAAPAVKPAEGQFTVAADKAPAAAQPEAQPEAQTEFGAPDNNGNVATDTVNAQTGDVNAANGQTDAGAAGQSGGQLEQQQAPIAKTYTIRSGDCLWNIAKDQLGDATKWSDIYKMNADVLGTNPSLIHPGASIQLPGAEGAAGASGGIAHYTVKPGDNLWDIAKNQMGDATKWTDLYKANHDIIGSNPDLIRPGQELTIDTGAADPGAAGQLSSTGTNAGAATGTNLAQAPAAQGAAAPQAGGEMNTLSQNPAGGDIPGINTYGDGLAQNNVQSSSAFEFEPAPMGQNIQAPQAPAMTPAKVLPVQAQPDAILQPAHAADLNTANMSAEAANAANSIAQGQKSLVNTNVGADLMSFLGKRR